jgi:hypothetical protein
VGQSKKTHAGIIEKRVQSFIWKGSIPSQKHPQLPKNEGGLQVWSLMDKAKAFTSMWVIKLIQNKSNHSGIHSPSPLTLLTTVYTRLIASRQKTLTEAPSTNKETEDPLYQKGYKAFTVLSGWS